ncbi:MAG: transposase [Burkholderiales bacterium]
MKSIPRRIFTAEFKREAIKRVVNQGLSLAEASRKLDIPTKSLRDWIAQSERGELKATLGAGKLTPDQYCIRELERVLAIARMERDISMVRGHVEKATAFFARESKGGTP